MQFGIRDGLGAAGEDVRFVPSNLGDPLVIGRHLVDFTEAFPNGAEREGFDFLLEGEASGGVALVFGLPQGLGGFEQGDEEGSLGGSGSDDPGGNAVDAGVEGVESDSDAGLEAVGDDFASDRE